MCCVFALFFQHFDLNFSQASSLSRLSPYQALSSQTLSGSLVSDPLRLSLSRKLLLRISIISSIIHVLNLLNIVSYDDYCR
ncbi:unnamed protein product [Brassica oleracea var. botrytis]|uniref:(rape) hypothetical protein n=1 Tax=Brassica napus TaxID=3708 RepID=A0A078H1Z0_BRANA|nr:unnamed protein product [Brassica napus]CDY30848.1 BnaC04g27030D [Brassica napus]